LKNKLIRSVIFDFNGTLFYDTNFHNSAWKKFAENHNVHLTSEDLSKNIHGHTNKEILLYLFNQNLQEDELMRYYEEKEEIYRAICRNHQDQCVLSPGAEKFLHYLSVNNIKKTIATASYDKNIVFYNDLFDLEQWFSLKQIIYDNGNYRGKPDPEMFLAAADILQTPIDECMIIEDSIMGITAAKNAKAGKIIAISESQTSNKFSGYNFVDQIITDFCQIDTSYFLLNP
jgi:beta-phosphoglucomutase